MHLTKKLSVLVLQAAPESRSLLEYDYYRLGRVVEVSSNGIASTREINLSELKSIGLQSQDVSSVDPSLGLTNKKPSILVREYAIFLNLGSLRAIAMQERVYIFNYEGSAFIDALLPRLNPTNMNGGPSMPFVLKVVGVALYSQIQHSTWNKD